MPASKAAGGSSVPLRRRAADATAVGAFCRLPAGPRPSVARGEPARRLPDAADRVSAPSLSAPARRSRAGRPARASAIVTRVRDRAVRARTSRSSRTVRLARAQGVRAEGGGGASAGTNAARKIRPASAIGPPASQDVSARRPPGRHQRHEPVDRSRRIRGEDHGEHRDHGDRPHREPVRWRPRRSRRETSTLRSAAARARRSAACSRRGRLAATGPVANSAPRRAASISALPFPQPTSIRRSPGRSPIASSVTAVAGSSVFAVGA